MHATVTPKLSWRLKELPGATGLSLPFWRKLVQNKKIRVQKIEGAIVIHDHVLRDFLGLKSEGNEPSAVNTSASVEAK